MNRFLAVVVVAAVVGLGWSLTPDSKSAPPKPPKPVIVVPAPPPEPKPITAPIPAEGLHVLIWRETDLNRVPEAQLEQFYGVRLRAWMKASRVDFRIWDQNIDAANETAEWQAAAKVKPGSLPWIVVSNGKTGYAGPLPESTEATIALLEKFK